MQINFWLLLILVMLCMMSVGSRLKETELLPENNFTMNWTHFDDLSWNSSASDDALARLNETVDYPTSSLLLNKIIIKSVDWLGFVFIETAKWCVHYGFENSRPYLAYVYLIIFLCFIHPIGLILVVLLLFVFWLYNLLSSQYARSNGEKE